MVESQARRPHTQHPWEPGHPGTGSQAPGRPRLPRPVLYCAGRGSHAVRVYRTQRCAFLASGSVPSSHPPILASPSSRLPFGPCCACCICTEVVSMWAVLGCRSPTHPFVHPIQPASSPVMLPISPSIPPIHPSIHPMGDGPGGPPENWKLTSCHSSVGGNAGNRVPEG